jgi:predicted enzyme related to lactoylglutathione lyase
MQLVFKLRRRADHRRQKGGDLMSTQEQPLKLKAKLIHVSVPGFQQQKQQDFWSKLFGIDFARSFTDDVESYHFPISEDGLFLTVGPPQDRRDSHITCFFAVDNLKYTLTDLQTSGGKVVTPPFEIPVAQRATSFYNNRLKVVGGSGNAPRGEFASVAYVEDPDGNLIGLIEAHESAKIWFGLGEHQKPLTAEQVAGHKATVAAGKIFESDKNARL